MRGGHGGIRFKGDVRGDKNSLIGLQREKSGSVNLRLG